MSKEQSVALLLVSLSISLALAVDICEYQMNGVYLAHPADCNKFVECQNGETYRISNCPLGLHFNRFKGVCDLRQRAACDIEFMNFMHEETNCSACCAIYGCYVSPECPATPGTPTTVVSPTNPLEPETSTTAASTPATLKTTLAYSSTRETTTSIFTAVSFETTRVPVTSSSPSTPDIPNTPITSASFSTPETTSVTFTPASPETTTVPVPASSPPTSDIPVKTTTPAATSSPEASSSTLAPVSSETPVTPDIPQTNQCPNKLTVCQKEPDNSAMHVNGTCNQYIVCVAGCAYKMSCPVNLQYNIAKQQCDYPQNVDCPWQSTPAIAGPSGITCAHQGQCEKQPDGKVLANPKSDGYIICQCECEVKRPCPEGTKFDTKLLTCAWKANKTESGNENKKKYEEDGKTENKITSESRNFTSTVCRNAVELCKNQAEGTLLPVKGICNKFYKCNFGCAIEILCPNNLIFNPLVEYCDNPTNYKCPWPFTSPTDPTAGPSGIACASGGRCAGRLDGTLFASQTSCTKYVVCQCECEVERNCAKNLYWDKNLLTCNYFENVNCELNL